MPPGNSRISPMKYSGSFNAANTPPLARYGAKLTVALMPSDHVTVTVWSARAMAAVIWYCMGGQRRLRKPEMCLQSGDEVGSVNLAPDKRLNNRIGLGVGVGKYPFNAVARISLPHRFAPTLHFFRGDLRLRVVRHS